MTVSAMAAIPYAETRSAARFTHTYGLPYRPRTVSEVPDGQLAKVISLAAKREARGLPRWGINSPIRHREPAPGAYGALGAGWLSRDHYLKAIVPKIVEDHREVLKRHKVAVDTFTRWVRIESLYAQDKRSGRNVIVRPRTVAELMQCCLRTTQKCRAAAREIGMYLDVVQGRMLNVEEARRARQSGSPQRGLSNVSCFVVPKQYHHQPTPAVKPQRRPQRPPTRDKNRGRLATIQQLHQASADPHPNDSSGDSCTPTSGSCFRTITSSSANSRTFNPHSGKVRNDAAPPRHRRRTRWSAAHSLAAELIRRVEWLQTSSPARIAPQLTRYAAQTAPWTADDLIAEFAAVDRRHGFWAPQRPRTRPWGLLRWYLEQISPTTARYRQRSRRVRQRAWCGNCESSSYRWITHSSGWAEPCPSCSPQASA